jgi:S1-C subfamily serine protease
VALIPPFFLDTVVAVGFANADGKVTYQATGFMYGHFLQQVNETTKRYKIFLVTNRHVFEGENKAFLRFNPESGEPARQYELNLVDVSRKPLWLAHEDLEIDVAVIGIDAEKLRQHGMRFSWFRGDQHIATRQNANDLGITEGDTVFVLGFPLGLVGKERDFVIVRQGAIARIRDCLEFNRKEFLVDCAVFPGNSGGPVVMRPEITSIEGTKPVNAAHLIGVVANYVTYRDVAVSQQTGKPRIIFEENSGLASVFPIDYVRDLAEQAAAAPKAPPTTEQPTKATGDA